MPDDLFSRVRLPPFMVTALDREAARAALKA
jgi:hypothetical protein